MLQGGKQKLINPEGSDLNMLDDTIKYRRRKLENI